MRMRVTKRASMAADAKSSDSKVFSHARNAIESQCIFTNTSFSGPQGTNQDGIHQTHYRGDSLQRQRVGYTGGENLGYESAASPYSFSAFVTGVWT